MRRSDLGSTHHTQSLRLDRNRDRDCDCHQSVDLRADGFADRRDDHEDDGRVRIWRLLESKITRTG